MAHISGTASGGLNAGYVLKAGQTLFDDQASDLLDGGAGRNWLLVLP